MDAAADEESLCRRCGVCCHEKIMVEGVVVITDRACAFLDPVSRLCRVYAERHAHQPQCATAARAAEMGALPGDCLYARRIPGYKAPQYLEDRPELVPVVDRLFGTRR